ncbi:MAG: Chemotaxis response regulator protein-glutamate methylesterase [Elusimicrobia bacterium]|nr:Chemotaxis response regulator protein-glutamate methylesterase [Elusimicrobiota bacterium]
MMKEPKQKALGTFEIAKRCHVTPTTVYRWIRGGKLRAFRTAGGRNRVLESDLAEFLRTLNISVRRVLIVDDELPTRRLMRRLIEHAFPKVEIDEATDGYEAGFKTRDLRPDLVILDLLLPSINGIKVCRIIRKSPNLKGTKILAVTGYKAEKSRRVFLRAGADAFLTKPFSTPDFVKMVSRLL